MNPIHCIDWRPPGFCNWSPYCMIKCRSKTIFNKSSLTVFCCSCVLMGLPLCRHSGPESNNRRARLCSLRPHSVQTCRPYRKSGERPLFTILSISGCNSSGAESASQSSQRSARRLARLVPHLAEGWLRRGLVNRKTSALFPQKRSTVPAKSETPDIHSVVMTTWPQLIGHV